MMNILTVATATDLTAELNWQFLDFKAEQLDKLCHVIQHHCGGQVHNRDTIQSCWDGDPLDVGGVSIKPNKVNLSGKGARLIARAYIMSRGLTAG